MNIRKIILLFLLSILLLGAVFLGFKIWTILTQKNKIKINIQKLPSVELRKTDGTILNTGSFKTSKKLLVLNYFNPDCDHCQSMVQELFKAKSLLENVKWVMITSAPVEKIKRFADSMKISQLKNVTVLNDTASQFIKVFGTVSAPSFFIYKNGELLRKHSGECRVTYLVQE
jgi:thiol-disulfide isomerase/thioredoxin